MLTLLGLLLIALGWFSQYFSLTKKDQKMKVSFLGLYSLGVAFLVIDGFTSGAIKIAVMNILTLVPAVLVWLKVRK